MTYTQTREYKRPRPIQQASVEVLRVYMADHVSNNEVNEEKKKRKVIPQKSNNEVGEKNNLRSGVLSFSRWEGTPDTIT